MSGGGESRFPPTMRLKRRDDFGRVYREGVVWKGRAFTLHVLARAGGARLGIKIFRTWGNAAERNRMKRRLREAFRLTASQLPDADIIVKPAPAAQNVSVDELGRMLVDAMHEVVGREVRE
jgi:ribonuclease P protein component